MVNWTDHIEGTVEGTPVNRKNLMAMQGFQEQTIVFNTNGSITETNESGETLETTFPAVNMIDEVFTNVNGLKIGKRTIFRADRSIKIEFIDFTT